MMNAYYEDYFYVYADGVRIDLPIGQAAPLEPGNNDVVIPTDLASGAYLLCCRAGNRTLTERFAVVR